ncbi:MAG: hypothetical protein LBS91_03015 [Clostridiales Family XIII bacterium]|jgi:transcriptional regulator with XRE-family HTH domain|nr:hypothetical protein [Clostridiales Family XIII bacterium]
MKPTYGTFVKPRFGEIAAWIRLGATDREVARRLGISDTTLRRYRKKHPELEELAREAKRPADELVIGALFKLATGYTVDCEKPLKVATEHIEGGKKIVREEVIVATYKEYIKPEVPAITFWLNNRMPDIFKRNAGKENLDEKRFELARQQADAEAWDV